MNWNVRIGINPISWSNDDLPELGGETTLETALSEGARIGFQGFELGNKFPKQPQALRDCLAHHGLACVSGWYSGELARIDVEEEKKRCAQHMEKLSFNGCKVVVYGETADSVQGLMHTPLSKRPRFVTQEQWRGYGRSLDAFGLHLKRNYDLVLAYHHHMGAYVESPADIDQLMHVTGENVGLLFDTGHAVFGGENDLVALLQRHLSRIVHVHCKDIRPEIIARSRNESWSFLQGVLAGQFTVPGDGSIDFKAVLSALHQGGYEGWLVVEAEQDPAVAPGFIYAQKGFQTIHSLKAEIDGFGEGKNHG